MCHLAGRKRPDPALIHRTVFILKRFPFVPSMISSFFSTDGKRHERTGDVEVGEGSGQEGCRSSKSKLAWEVTLVESAQLHDDVLSSSDDEASWWDLMGSSHDP